MNPTDFMRQLAAAQDDSDDDGVAKIDPQAALMRLKEAAVRYREADKGPRFKLGDIITPLPDSTLKGAGQPHIVIAIGSSEHLRPNGDASGHMTWGARRDIRVLCFVPRGSMAAFWVESSEFVRWDGQ